MVQVGPIMAALTLALLSAFCPRAALAKVQTERENEQMADQTLQDVLQDLLKSENIETNSEVLSPENRAISPEALLNAPIEERSVNPTQPDKSLGQFELARRSFMTRCQDHPFLCQALYSSGSKRGFSDGRSAQGSLTGEDNSQGRLTMLRRALKTLLGADYGRPVVSVVRQPAIQAAGHTGSLLSRFMVREGTPNLPSHGDYEKLKDLALRLYTAVDIGEQGIL